MVRTSTVTRQRPQDAPHENVKSDVRVTPKKQAKKAPPVLVRTTFETSREMDFFSERELVTQTGHDIEEWPLVMPKECIDNSLDACEEADISPVIDVVVDGAGITVRDNGPGLPASTLTAAMNFRVRASNREAYVSPTRGAQGNALKTLLPMPVVVDPQHGRLVVQAHGKRHEIHCKADPITQQPVIHDDATDLPTIGTEIRMEWAPVLDVDGDVVWPFKNLLPTFRSFRFGAPSFAERFRNLIEGFAVFNPHATITLDWFGDRKTWEATDPTWKKWKPNKPTSTHWYEPEHLRRLIAGYITEDRRRGTDRLVSAVIAEFDGLHGSQKRAKVLQETDLHRVPLSAFVVNGSLDEKRIELLLKIMRANTRPVKSQYLGVIGEDHFRERLLAMGVEPNSFRYSKKLSKDGLPAVLESAFGWLGPNARDSRRIFAGANWSAAIKNPFRSFGHTGQGLEASLAEMKAGANEPIVFGLHLAHPRIQYTDRGKSALVVSGDDCYQEDGR